MVEAAACSARRFCARKAGGSLLAGSGVVVRATGVPAMAPVAGLAAFLPPRSGIFGPALRASFSRRALTVIMCVQRVSSW